MELTNDSPEIAHGNPEGDSLDTTAHYPDIPVHHAVAMPIDTPLPTPPSEAGVEPLHPSGSLAIGVPGLPVLATKPKLVVLRGEKIDMHYPVYNGKNYIGRTDEKPVDIDLENQEAPDRIWTSRQHAVITFEQGILTVEDLNSLNGTFVNRARVHPGQVRTLQVHDVIQIGTVQMRVIYV